MQANPVQSHLYRVQGEKRLLESICRHKTNQPYFELKADHEKSLFSFDSRTRDSRQEVLHRTGEALARILLLEESPLELEVRTRIFL